MLQSFIYMIVSSKTYFTISDVLRAQLEMLIQFMHKEKKKRNFVGFSSFCVLFLALYYLSGIPDEQ